MSLDRIAETRADVLKSGIIVAVRLQVGGQLVDICRALARGGINVLELTLTTPGALAAIQQLSTDDELIVGAGTVLTPEDADRVAEAGGRFAFSPVVDAEVIGAAHRCGLMAVPGASTPTEILSAHRVGADLVKVFPAGPLGGVDFLRKVRGPLPDIALVPTSGPTARDIGDYLAAGAAAVGVGGEELFPPGFTVDGVELAARRIRTAFDEAR
jgi:2-dehydro-3-deoxyphosphogluconate aldolase/(4S)-4-hydroxy-2-oxoglutarate aldolase